MNDSDRRKICHAISSRLQEIVRFHLFDFITEERLVELVLSEEEVSHQEQGLTISAANTLDGWTNITVWIDGSREPCASFEFKSGTCTFREPAPGKMLDCGE